MRSNACKDTTPHAVRKPLSSFSGMQMGCEWIATKMELLVRCNVQPVIVWDGRPLKSKGDHAGASREESGRLQVPIWLHSSTREVTLHQTKASNE